MRYVQMKSIVFSPSAQRQWAKLSVDVRLRLRTRLKELAASGGGDLKRLRGRDGTRLRVGEWRVILFMTPDEIRVTAVGHRREIYD